jgi:hypothetical protein
VDLRFAMPPQPGVWVGAYETIKGLGGRRLRRGRRYRLECRTRSPTGQSAVAMYPRRPEASVYEAFMDVLRVEDGLIAEIVTFDSEVFDWFRLSSQLGAPADLPGREVRQAKESTT